MEILILMALVVFIVWVMQDRDKPKTSYTERKINVPRRKSKPKLKKAHSFSTSARDLKLAHLPRRTAARTKHQTMTQRLTAARARKKHSGNYFNISARRIAERAAYASSTHATSNRSGRSAKSSSRSRIQQSDTTLHTSAIVGADAGSGYSGSSSSCSSSSSSSSSSCGGGGD